MLFSIIAIASTVIATSAPPAPRHPPSCDGGQIECVVSGDTLFMISESNGLKLEELTIANPQFSSNIDLIFPGDRVCIPTICNPIRKSAECVGELLTLVESGDTLYKLAMSNNLNFTVLMGVNPQLGPDFDLIFPGDEVCRPKNCPSYKAEHADKVVSKYDCVKDDVVVQATSPASNTTVATNTTIPTHYSSEPVTREARFPESCDGVNVQCAIPGDSLYAIAMHHGFTLESLKESNPQFSENFDLIFPGDKVCISGNSYPLRKPSVCDGEILTRVKCGDTLYELALANDLSLETMIEANPQLGPDYDLIFPGDQVCKPKNCPSYNEEEKEEYDTKYNITSDKEVGSEIDEGYTVSQFATSSATVLLVSIVALFALMF